jgi:3-oxoacyl-[acyl-carrier protein] reductase
MRKVVVTGGSRGLGLATARILVAEGFEVIAIARRTTDDLDGAIRETAQDRPRLHFMPFDLGAVDAIPELAKAIRAAHGHIYGLVNNAAIGTSGMLSNARIEQVQRQIDLNVTSPILLTKHMVRSMIAGGDGGRIVNISSIVAATGYSGLSVYSATKAAMIGFTKSLAREVGPLGINVNAVAPGFVDTEMTGEMGQDHKATIARRSALKRMPEAIDVANAVAFLLGDRSRNITGTVMTVDAGNTA